MFFFVLGIIIVVCFLRNVCSTHSYLPGYKRQNSIGAQFEIYSDEPKDPEVCYRSIDGTITPNLYIVCIFEEWAWNDTGIGNAHHKFKPPTSSKLFFNFNTEYSRQNM